MEKKPGSPTKLKPSTKRYITTSPLHFSPSPLNPSSSKRRHLNLNSSSTNSTFNGHSEICAAGRSASQNENSLEMEMYASGEFGVGISKGCGKSTKTKVANCDVSHTSTSNTSNTSSGSNGSSNFGGSGSSVLLGKNSKDGSNERSENAMSGVEQETSETDSSKSSEGVGGETLNVEYWNELYGYNEKHQTTCEYQISYQLLRKFIMEIAPPEKNRRVLVPGCGDSDFSISLLKDGYNPVYSTDISAKAIESMRRRYRGNKGLYWITDDARDMQFEDDFFTYVLDKSLLDCFFWVKDAKFDLQQAVSLVLNEFHRTLRKSGKAVIVTEKGEQDFLPLVEKGKWYIEYQVICVQTVQGRVPKIGASCYYEDYLKNDDKVCVEADISTQEESGTHTKEKKVHIQLFYVFVLTKM